MANHFWKKAPSWIFDLVINTALVVIGNVSVQNFLLLDK